MPLPSITNPFRSHKTKVDDAAPVVQPEATKTVAEEIAELQGTLDRKADEIAQFEAAQHGAAAELNVAESRYVFRNTKVPAKDRPPFDANSLSPNARHLYQLRQEPLAIQARIKALEDVIQTQESLTYL